MIQRRTKQPPFFDDDIKDDRGFGFSARKGLRLFSKYSTPKEHSKSGKSVDEKKKHTNISKLRVRVGLNDFYLLRYLEFPFPLGYSAWIIKGMSARKKVT